jgi:hypothetical protein
MLAPVKKAFFVASSLTLTIEGQLVVVLVDFVLGGVKPSSCKVMWSIRASGICVWFDEKLIRVKVVCLPKILEWNSNRVPGSGLWLNDEDRALKDKNWGKWRRHDNVIMGPFSGAFVGFAQATRPRESDRRSLGGEPLAAVA